MATQVEFTDQEVDLLQMVLEAWKDGNEHAMQETEKDHSIEDLETYMEVQAQYAEQNELITGILIRMGVT